MTEQTLGEAIKIKRQIDHLRERKAEVEKVRAWCKEGNASFKIQTTEAGFSRDGVAISGATAKLVLDKELEEIKRSLKPCWLSCLPCIEGGRGSEHTESGGQGFK